MEGLEKIVSKTYSHYCFCYTKPLWITLLQMKSLVGLQVRKLMRKSRPSCVLTHYDPSRPLILACDTSPCEIGAVLSHKVGDNEPPMDFIHITT